MSVDLIHTALQRHASMHPEALAVSDRGIDTTYGELWRLVSDAAAGLRKDIAPGARVAYLAHRDLNTVVMHHGLAVAGLVGVPLNPEAPEAERDKMCEGVVDVTIGDSSPARVDREHAASTANGGGGTPPLDPSSEHSVVFTSGSSGSPTGVLLSHGNAAAAAGAAAAHLSLSGTDRWLGSLPLFHVGGLAVLWRMVHVGGAVVFDSDSFDVYSTVSHINAGSITWLSVVPTMLQRVLVHGLDVRHSVSVLVGGGPVAIALIVEARAAGLAVFATYGMTETTSQAVTATDSSVTGDGVVRGRPLPGVTVEVVGSDGDIRSEGTGRLVISGATVAIGTVGGQRFNGRYVTNDVGRIDSAGTVQVLGRADDVVITGGENVYPQEVENALRSCGATGAVVWGIDDEHWGQALVGVVTLRDDETLDAVLSKLQKTVSAHRVPKRLREVVEFPMLANEKIDRRTVRESHIFE